VQARNRSPQKAYFWRLGRAGEFWKRVTRRVGPEQVAHLAFVTSVEVTDARWP
jgi:hypothetical protein